MPLVACRAFQLAVAMHMVRNEKTIRMARAEAVDHNR